MFLRGIACTLILFVGAIRQVSAAVQNATLVAGSSDNITFNGGGWQGPGNWQGLDPENESCTTSPGIYSWTPGASVSVVFQGVAIYFVGWNNSRNGFYQPYLDGVPDSPVSAYLPGPISGPWVCNVIQYTRTGLANIQHNLTMALLTDDPGNIGVPGMSISGVIVTTKDDELPFSIPIVIPTTILSVAPNSTAVLTQTDPNGIIVPTRSDTSQSLNSTQVVGTVTTSTVLSSTRSLFSATGTATGGPAVAQSNGSVSDQLRPVSATAIAGIPSGTASSVAIRSSSVLLTSTSALASSQSFGSNKFIGSSPSVSNTNTPSASTTGTTASNRSPSIEIGPSSTTAVVSATGSTSSTTGSKVTGLPAAANTRSARVIPSSLTVTTAASPLARTTSSLTASTLPVSSKAPGSTSTTLNPGSARLLSLSSGSPPTVAPTPEEIMSIPTRRSSSTPEPSPVQVTVLPMAAHSPSNRAGSSGSATSSSILFSPTEKGGFTPTTTNEPSLRTIPASVSVSLAISNTVSSTLGNERPVLPATTNVIGSSVSTTIPGPTTNVLVSGKSSSKRATIAGSVVGAVVGLVAILGLISFASWAHQISHAKKASKPGAFKSKAHQFNFVIPPYLPDRKPRRNSFSSFQITLTLTPVDIEENYTYQQVAWQTFKVVQSDKSSTVTKRLDYDRGFGAANIMDGGDAIGGAAFCKRPQFFEHAKPGRPVPFRGQTWSNPLQFIAQKYRRIIARNDDHVPLRLVIGSYVCPENQRRSTLGPDDMDGQDVVEEVGFQSFVLMDEKIGYAEQVSASFDLVLRAYKTQDIQVEQILSPAYVKHKAVPLLGEDGIRLSKLPMVATWLVDTDGSDVRLKMESPGWGQYLSEFL
ncbi:hypothetical protein B0H16DRAFT_1506355 [Mycena metata]|uniref:Uncharacterized protein n=1 Tax=Mycena metata TaxID=1033252 RepID=A0AAD7K5Y0_9AGAR|nr:hypothetical protein B0H16DRAFT_1506355 [Mycena metata]